MTSFFKKATKLDRLPEKMENFDNFLQPKIQKTSQIKAFQVLKYVIKYLSKIKYFF